VVVYCKNRIIGVGLETKAHTLFKKVDGIDTRQAKEVTEHKGSEKEEG